ncbi:unnamed protein product [Heligmosomoides polygyrus]|uniref:Uncharacterized protein n=1 Tax=Heligmosomoides polygyrus TaxID=6339 RepID=A0A183FNL9_HELPZ|nr:unnamed protein product [Heligmosomoides polygyrus]
MDLIFLFVLYALLFVNFISFCKKSEKSDKKKRKKKKDRRDRDERSTQLGTPFPPGPGDHPPTMATAREAEEQQGGGGADTFKCRDYTPAIFNDLQGLFELLKRP